MQEPEQNETPPSEAQIDPKHEKLRAELARLTAKRSSAKDKDILSVLDMRILQIQQELPPALWPKEGAEPVKEKEEPEEELPDVPEPTAEERDKAEKLIRQARLEKQRGNAAAATKLLRDAVDVAPGSVVVMEALADDLIERKQMKEARKILKRAHHLDPKNVALERKFAEVVLKGSANMNIEEQLRLGLSDSMFLTDNDKVAGIWAARFLSFFIPGVGQMVVGRTGKGIAMFVGYAICFGLIIVWQNDVKSLLLMFSKSHTGNINPLVFIPLIGGIAIWLMAMGDLSGGQSKSVVRKRIEHPKPPADLPFD